MDGRNGTTAFLPLESRIGGQVRCIHPSVGQFLTREQTKFIHRKIDRRNSKHRHDRTRNRMGKAAQQNG